MLKKTTLHILNVTIIFRMSDYDDSSPVVIDNGSGTIRAGFAGDEDQTCVNSYSYRQTKVIYKM